MVTDRERTTVLSSLGWVDGDAIWCLDVASGQARVIPQNTGAKHTTVQSSDTERFVALHHFEGARFMASVGLFSAPEITVASASYENGRTSLTGDAEAWHGLPHLFVTHLAKPWNDFVLVKIDSGHMHLQRLEWYDDSYDKSYQGVVGVLALPDPRYALVSVQRSSVLIVHDLETGKAHQQVALANRGGTPRVTLRGNELWADDYDTLVVLDLRSLRVVRTKLLQGARDGARQFIGGYSFALDGMCCVARPYSGDVVAVDQRLKVRRTAKLGGQPLAAIELAGGDVIARDWQTGELLRGRMEPRTWIRNLWA